MPHRFFLLTSLAVITTASTPAIAQPVLGSGIVASQKANSTTRPIGFAPQAPEDAALVIAMDSATVPANAPLTAAERTAVKAAVETDKFEGKMGKQLMLRGIGTRPQILLVGAKKADDSGADWKSAAGSAAQKLMSLKAPVAIAGPDSGAALAELALGYALGQYRFDRYQTGKTPPPADPVTVVGSQAQTAKQYWDGRYAALSDGVYFARDLSSEPASTVYPASFVEKTRAAFAGMPNVTIEVLNEAQMRKMNMGAIVGVGQGSPRGSRMMLVTYKGASGPPLAIAGKGITFDTGGISIKPNSGMWRMKADMSGAASVMGAALSLAKSRAPVHIVAVAALAENMPGANAQRPGDVVRTYGGKTIEILSTDAEGRLVLADAVQYVADKKKPFGLVDVATLTGAVGRALGPEYAGLFSRHDKVADRLMAAADKTGEALWRLPLNPAYKKAIKSDIADVKNSDTSPAPGASAGAHFIGTFVDKDMPWAHLDIASVMWNRSAKPLGPKGSPGFGVRLLDELARNWKPE